MARDDRNNRKVRRWKANRTCVNSLQSEVNVPNQLKKQGLSKQKLVNACDAIIISD